MPANAQSVALTDRYRATLMQATATLEVAAAALWRQKLNGQDLAGSFPAWQDAMVGLTAATQRALASMSQTYLAMYARSEGASAHAVFPPGGDLGQFVGVAQDGRELGIVLEPALIQVKVRLKAGDDLMASLASGLARGTRASTNAVMWSSRAALDQAMTADPRVIGWRRVARPTACGACMASVTGAIQHEREVLACHDHCHCTKEPVLADVSETVHRQTGRQMFDSLTPAAQNAMFSGAGGKDAADLIRTGEVPFEALIQRMPMDLYPDQITQQTYEGLLAHRA